MEGAGLAHSLVPFQFHPTPCYRLSHPLLPHPFRTMTGLFIVCWGYCPLPLPQPALHPPAHAGPHTSAPST